MKPEDLTNLISHLSNISTAAVTLYGAAVAFASVLGAALPQSWALTQWCAHLGTNFRGTPAPGTGGNIAPPKD